ncbi:hypothetical protein CEUSTIGMA_g2418.t1 [Chlamydomonas eustigma]|uniref:Fungal lipase-type domain-containing protein n=1 Tax=Chlamydomonas eustigma TaxID=1157962 RepID=A0A250WWH8_9CHLO|nr:hypothetical protein CEUSTIGMA_g2418.t1 [Chlamydomonas eustigma]|eukprot:GAX74972.1 hypothetical protein CEUSTIGMA_g2418.t1 [Chlamydomonas eustigma]
MHNEKTSETNEPDVSLEVWENRQLFLCFGWHGPLLTPRWINKQGHYVKKGSGRPSTTAYRGALEGKGLTEENNREWSIAVDEHTDELGWQYGGCGFREILNKRMSTRSRPKLLDLIKRRRWMHRKAVENHNYTGQRGNLKLLDPVQMYNQRKEAQAKLDGAKAAIWDLIDELDSSARIKDLYTALLDPVAMNRVSNVHKRAMATEQKEALILHHPVTLSRTEIWPETKKASRLQFEIPPDIDDNQQSLASPFTGQPSAWSFFASSPSSMLNTMSSRVMVLGSNLKEILKSRRPSGTFNSRADIHSVSQQRYRDMPGRSSAGFAHGIIEEVEEAHGAAETPGSTIFGTLHNIYEAAEYSVDASTSSPTGCEPKTSQQPQQEMSTHAAASAFQRVHNNTDVPGGSKAYITTDDSHRAEDAAEKPEAPMASRIQSAVVDSVRRMRLNWQRRRHFRALRRVEDGVIESAPFKISVPELECCYVHALAAYGDITLYIDGLPAQTYELAIFKLTGVPQEDVLKVHWRSNTFEPVHYLALDRKFQKIVISIRGTTDFSDVVTDLVGRPVPHDFTPSLTGHVHEGMLHAARFVVASIRTALQRAVTQEPDFKVLVTGHSMGGGIASLVALLLHSDPSGLSRSMSNCVRAVCLAPAAVMDEHLSSTCNSFIASIVLGNDVVPRVAVHSVTKFVQEVARASPLKMALLRWKKILGERLHLTSQVTGMPPLHAPGAVLWILSPLDRMASKRARAQSKQQVQAYGPDPSTCLRFFACITASDASAAVAKEESSLKSHQQSQKNAQSGLSVGTQEPLGAMEVSMSPQLNGHIQAVPVNPKNSSTKLAATRQIDIVAEPCRSPTGTRAAPADNMQEPSSANRRFPSIIPFTGAILSDVPGHESGMVDETRHHAFPEEHEPVIASPETLLKREVTSRDVDHCQEHSEQPDDSSGRDEENMNDSAGRDEENMNDSSGRVEDNMNDSSGRVEDNMNDSSGRDEENMNDSSGRDEENLNDSSGRVEDNMNDSSGRDEENMNDSSGRDEENMNDSSGRVEDNMNDMTDTQVTAGAADGSMPTGNCLQDHPNTVAEAEMDNEGGGETSYRQPLQVPSSCKVLSAEQHVTPLLGEVIISVTSSAQIDDRDDAGEAGGDLRDDPHEKTPRLHSGNNFGRDALVEMLVSELDEESVVVQDPLGFSRIQEAAKTARLSSDKKQAPAGAVRKVLGGHIHYPLPDIASVTAGDNSWTTATSSRDNGTVEGVQNGKTERRKYELRYVSSKELSTIRFFKKALTDHSPVEYLNAIEDVIVQQKALHAHLEQQGLLKDHDAAENELQGDRSKRAGSHVNLSSQKASTSNKLKLRSYESNRY